MHLQSVLNVGRPETTQMLSTLEGGGRTRRAIVVLLLLGMALYATVVSAQQVEPSLPSSQRVTINLSAGMPGQSQWLYLKDSDSTSYATTAYNDTGWTPVGIPYSANVLTSFLNADSGGGDGDLNGTNNWYRLHFTLGTQYANSKVMVEFEGAHTGAQVYINGTLLPGISQVAANAQASHVVGFVPFIVDLTPYVKTDGTTVNVLAVSVARNNTWFEQPGFSQDYRFGQADAGLFRPVDMIITNKVHIPLNIYSNQKTWGTYVATVSEVPAATGTTTAASALIEVQTNVLNETTTSQQVTLTTQIVDAAGNVVATAPSSTQTVAPMTSSTFPSSATPMFDQQITVTNPTLWYPNNSIYGTPYMYRVYHIVSVNGVVVDSAQSPLGIRTITWDHNFPYFNGHPMYLWGASGRYDYPALGSSVPEEQQWRDLALLAAEGGNIWRPGHSTTSEEFVNAADAYGIMIDQPSGDGEGAFATPTADMVTLKQELHRDMIIRDRSHPSILDWEADNGTTNETVGKALASIAQTWDPINTRVEADRTPDPVNGYMLGCTLEGCEVGVKSQYPNNPAWGAEYWGNGTGRGLAWDYELAFAAPFLDNWRKGKAANAFGMAQWYFADSPGEDSLYLEYTGKASMQSMVRSLGASSVDMNRFPKSLYYIYKAAWTPFSVKPVVYLAHHWNRLGSIQVNAFSNCPSVRLLINGVAQGSDQIPNAWNSDATSNMTQTTTLMPFQVHWNVNWASGTVTAECLDTYGTVQATDSRVTAGAEDHIELDVVPELTRPDGTSFAVTANGSDAAFIVAKVVDANGNVVPTASDNITFSVSGPATYMGGSQQYVSTATDAYSTAHSELNYHAPGDPQLQAEGGMTKIAIRSQFTAGTVTVSATASGLKTGTATYTIVAPPSNTSSTTPSIIVPPASTAVTVGYSAVFSVTATGTAPLSFQWKKNGTAISGATGATYTTPATTTADNNASFTVTVTNSLGSATSSAAILTVAAAANVVINTQPASQTAYVGQTVQLSVAATGSPALSYQWRKGGVAITGATSSSYTTPVLASGDNGAGFSVVVSNPVSNVTSAAAVITVNPAQPPVITQQPASVSVLANNPATFSVGLSGSSPFTYQWQLNGVNLLGANGPTYSILAVQSTNVGSYTVVVTNVAGSATSAAATLTIAPPGVNLALGQPATASSYQDSVGMPASAAFDGNLTTRWASVGGVDPSWIQVDLGSTQAFNNVILYWEAAYATVYQIQYSTDNSTWSVAYTNNNGVGGVENLTFPTVKGRYVRMNGTTRVGPYGYSLYEFQVYNIAQCGGTGERYTVLGTSSVRDNVSQLTWQRSETTYASGGAQYTQSIAQTYCTGQSMRLPTQAEALAISGAASAVCAFPQAWNTWTSTVDPANGNDDAFVSSTGMSSWQVANNYPGGVMCDSGTTVPPPTIATQPTTQTVVTGATATFTVVAGSNGPFTYQWYKNAIPITAAIAASYTTPPVASFDNGALFNVVVTGPTDETVTSSNAVLNVGSGQSGAPTITTQPAAQTVVVGSTATFSVVASGAGTLTYQWQKNSANISGATAASYTTPATVAGDSGSLFSVVVTNASGAVTSNTALLTVTGSSSTLSINSGGPATGSFVADEYFSGGGAATSTNTITTAGVANAAPMAVYQSERAGVFTYTIPGLTAGATYTVRLHFAEFYWTLAGQRVFNVSINGSTVLANFDIVATGGANKAVVEQFTPTANSSGQILISFTAGTADQPKVSGIEILSATVAAPTITTQPAAQTIAVDATATFSVVASGAGTLTYQWQKNSTNISGATAASYTTPATVAGDNGTLFRVVVTNAGGSVTSNTALLTVTSAPTITTQPAAETVTVGSTATFSVVASGTGTLTYQWQRNSANISGATAASYTTPATVAGDSGALFRVVVTSAGGSVTSNTALLTVTGTTSTLAINAGGPATGTFVADADYSGGGSAITTNTITTTGVTNAAPMAVYQSERAGVFTYTIPGLTAGTSYPVRLHFAEFYWTQAGKRVFNVSINGTAVLTNFDIFATAGSNKALVEQFSATANSSGQIVISFTAGTADQPKVSGLEIVSATVNAPTITTQPSPQTVAVGGTSTFSVVASGSGTLSYQWQKNSTNISGATAASYTTPATVSGDNGALFRAVVTNAGGSATSNTALLTVTSGSLPTIAAQPAAQTVTIGTVGQFTVTASGSGTLTYQWQKNGVNIAGATAQSYITPAATQADNGAKYGVVVANSGGSVTSSSATLTVNSSPAYAIYPGYIGTDLNNNTHGVWKDSQIYITVLGNNPTTGVLSWLSANGTLTAASLADNTASNALTGPDGQTYPNYAFTLAQSKLMKLPPMSSGRIFVSLGSPLYMKIMAGNPLGYAGPNPLNASDPNININYDWYEFTYGATGGIYINTTQVDQFGLPMTLDVWGASETFHMQTGITESITAIDQEFTNETPADFHLTPVSPLRIFSPANSTFNTGEANANYFDNYVSTIWSDYSSAPLTVQLYGSSREFTGTTQGAQFVFTEVNLNNGAYVGGTYTVGKPTTQDILYCSGTLATGSGVVAALEAQFCAAFNRHVMENYTQWTIPADYYYTSPANSYAQFWHNHSIGGLAYGFAYDDVNNQSSTVMSPTPEHMAFGIGW